MIWDKEVAELADKVESHILQGQAQEALKYFKKLRKLTGLQPPVAYALSPAALDQDFCNSLLPDED